MPADFSQGAPPPRRRPQNSRTAESKKPVGRLPTSKELTSGFTMLLQMSQAILGGIFPAAREYLLTKEEAQMLADALAGEALAQPGFKKLVIGAQRNATHMKLMVTLTMLAVPRLMKLGVLPGELDIDPAAFSDLMGSWPAPGFGGSDGFGEVDPSVMPPGALEVLRGNPYEAGRRDVPGSGDGEGWESTEPPVSQPTPPGTGLRAPGSGDS